MSTAKLKQSIIDLIHSTEDENKLILAYKALKTDSHDDWWDDLTKKEKDSIQEGLNDLNKGNLTSHSEAIKQMIKKYPQLNF